MLDTNVVEKLTPQSGNNNPQMGAANKKMIEDRLNNKDDVLTFNLVKLVCPEVKEILSSCVVRSDGDVSLRNSEMAFLYEAKTTAGEVVSDSINVAAKGSMGLGSLNQLAIFWLNSVLSQEELATDVGVAITKLVGAASNSEEASVPLHPCDLVSGENFKKYGMPLQLWLAQQENISKFIFKALAVKPGVTGKNVLLLNMREGSLEGDDLFVMVDAGSLGRAILNEVIEETTSGQKFVRITKEDKVLKLSRAMSFKRVGGNNARGHGANQCQMIINTKGLLDMLVHPKKNNKVTFCVGTETPTLASKAINLMKEDYDANEEPEYGTSLTHLLNAVDKVSVNFDKS